MNRLAYRFSDLYISQTLFYGGLLMASNMMWAHEIGHYLAMGHFNMLGFSVGKRNSINEIYVIDRKLFFDCVY